MNFSIDYTLYQGGIPDRQFVRFKANGGPKSIWRRSPLEGFQPDVTIVIPTADAYRSGLFLKLIDQLTDPAFSRAEIIVIVGDSRQGRAINMGVALSCAEFILTMDDDTYLYGIDWLDRLLMVMRQNPDIGLAGGLNCIPVDALPFVRKAMAQLPRRMSLPVTNITDSDLAEHPLLMIRRVDFIAVGGEHEGLPRGLDPYLRECFRQYGRRVVVVPGVKYSHLPPETPEKLVKQFFRNGRYSAFCQHHYPQWQIETPNAHVNHFIRKRPFSYRLARHAFTLLQRFVAGHWIYIMAYLSYGLGFTWEIIRPTKKPLSER